jgi:hypothetical protein
MSETNKPDDKGPKIDDFSSALEAARFAGAESNGNITKEQVAALIQRYHFLQIYGPGGKSLDAIECIRVESSAITVLNYGDAMTTSAGAAIYDTQPPSDVTENYLGGTIVARMWNTARAMALKAKEMGWENIHVVDGSSLMKTAMLVHANEVDLAITPADYSKAEVRKITALEKFLGLANEHTDPSGGLSSEG